MKIKNKIKFVSLTALTLGIPVFCGVAFGTNLLIPSINKITVKSPADVQFNSSNIGTNQNNKPAVLKDELLKVDASFNMFDSKNQKLTQIKPTKIGITSAQTGTQQNQNNQFSAWIDKSGITIDNSKVVTKTESDKDLYKIKYQKINNQFQPSGQVVTVSLKNGDTTQQQPTTAEYKWDTSSISGNGNAQQPNKTEHKISLDAKDKAVLIEFTYKKDKREIIKYEGTGTTQNNSKPISELKAKSWPSDESGQSQTETMSFLLYKGYTAPSNNAPTTKNAANNNNHLFWQKEDGSDDLTGYKNNLVDSSKLTTQIMASHFAGSTDESYKKFLEATKKTADTPQQPPAPRTTTPGTPWYNDLLSLDINNLPDQKIEITSHASSGAKSIVFKLKPDGRRLDARLGFRTGEASNRKGMGFSTSGSMNNPFVDWSSSEKDLSDSIRIEVTPKPQHFSTKTSAAFPLLIVVAPLILIWLIAATTWLIAIFKGFNKRTSSK